MTMHTVQGPKIFVSAVRNRMTKFGMNHWVHSYLTLVSISSYKNVQLQTKPPD